MTRDDLLKMAQEAGLVRFEGGELDAYGVGKASPSDHSVAAWSVATEEKIARLVALAAAAEREECAKVCEELGEESGYNTGRIWGSGLATAIRARSQP